VFSALERLFCTSNTNSAEGTLRSSPVHNRAPWLIFVSIEKVINNLSEAQDWREVIAFRRSPSEVSIKASTASGSMESDSWQKRAK